MPLRGYHVYMKRWTPEIGQDITLEVEKNNPYDKYAIAGHYCDDIVGRVPKEVSRLFYDLITKHPMIRITATVAQENKVKSKEGKGLEILLKVVFCGRKADKTALRSFYRTVKKKNIIQDCELNIQL